MSDQCWNSCCTRLSDGKRNNISCRLRSIQLPVSSFAGGGAQHAHHDNPQPYAAGPQRPYVSHTQPGGEEKTAEFQSMPVVVAQPMEKKWNHSRTVFFVGLIFLRGIVFVHINSIIRAAARWWHLLVESVTYSQLAVGEGMFVLFCGCSLRPFFISIVIGKRPRVVFVQLALEGNSPL